MMICLEVNQETCLNNAALTTPIPSTHILRFIIAVFVLFMIPPNIFLPLTPKSVVVLTRLTPRSDCVVS